LAAFNYPGPDGLGKPKIKGTSTFKETCVIMQPPSIRLPKPKLQGLAMKKLDAVSVIRESLSINNYPKDAQSTRFMEPVICLRENSSESSGCIG
jgi:hypothetical protein